jgi:hypothetical protein
MGINYWAVLLASIAEFMIGGIWFMPIFGNLWGKIHDFEKLNKDEKKDAQRKMAPMLFVQFVVTVITTLVLAKLIIIVPSYSVYTLALLAWIGFVVPTQIAAIIFGGTKPKWILTKALIMAGGSVLCLIVAAAILKAV